MQRLLSILFVVFAIVFSSAGEESNDKPTSYPIGINIQKNQNESPSSVHRARARINVEVYYDVVTNSIEISYNGEDDGEVFLYLNDNIIDYDCQINTTFYLPTNTGSYYIEIVNESWTAMGYIQL